MDEKRKTTTRVNLKIPQAVKENKEAAVIFRQIQAYLKEFRKLEKVDSYSVGILAISIWEVETFTMYLAGKSYVYIDKNKFERRRPQVMMRKDAADRVAQYLKLLGVDRSFREKGRGEALSRGRKPVDKIGRLRKVGRKAS